MQSDRIVCIAAVLLTAGIAAASTVWGPVETYPGTANWNVAANWTRGVPVASGVEDEGGNDPKAVFNVANAAVCIVDSEAVCGQFSMGDGGTLNGTFMRIVNGGTLTTHTDLWSAVGYNRSATLTVEAGGYLETRRNLLVGRDGMAGTGPVGACPSYLIIDGGTVVVTDNLQLGNNDADKVDGGGIVYVNSGLLDIRNNLAMENVAVSRLDIRYGTVIINGDRRENLNTWTAGANPIVTGFGGDGTVVYDYGVTLTGKTTLTAISPQTASSPSPSNGADGVSIFANLTWAAGIDAVSYDVYFGTNPNPGAAEFKIKQAGTTFYPGLLNPNTTYYWRIDAVHPDHAESPWTGHVWSFKTDVTSAAGKIVYPWNAVTAIVKAGESFEVWFDAEPGQTVNSAVLRGPYNAVHIPSIAAVTGSWTYDPVSGNTYNTRISVAVPAGAPADRYDLILNTSYGQVISVSGVQVIREYKANYKIFHISDSHLAQATNTQGLVEAKHTALVHMANIINPDIVFNTGDNVYYTSVKERFQERMDLFFLGDASAGWKGMHHFNAATFVVAGNHDYQQAGSDQLPPQGYYDLKSDHWNRYYGLQSHTFKYGNGRFLLFNNSWVDYDWSWQRNRAANWLSSEGAGGNLKILAAHLNQGGAMGTFVGNNNVGLVTIGHNHHLGDRNPYLSDNRLIAYYARSVRDHLEFCLFLVDDSTGTYTPLGYMNTNPDTDGFGLSTGSNRVLENDNEKNNPDMSAWIYNLTLNYAYANDGSVSSNTATLVNKFNYTIPDARVRFVMPQGTGYVVSQGTIHQAFDGDHFHIVDVDIDLTANSTTVVEIAAEDNAPTVVIDMPDTITWVGEPVQLNASIGDAESSSLSIEWTSTHPESVTFFPNNAVADPTVSVSEAADDVAITATVWDAASPHQTAADTMTLSVAADACQAAIIAGVAVDFPGDLTGDDCVIDLTDVVLLASEWLFDYALTEPAVIP